MDLRSLLRALRFRYKFLTQGALEHIHLFVSRDKVFTQESVLQETVIIKVKKTTEPPAHITVSTSQSNSDFSELTSFQAPYHTVVHGPANYVYLVTNDTDVQTLEQLSHLTYTLPKLGLKMRTGLTVDYRNQAALRDHAELHAVPLFYAHHLKKGQVQFPQGKEPEYLVTTQKGLLQKNSNYLFVKRFTAKEEPRRREGRATPLTVCDLSGAQLSAVHTHQHRQQAQLYLRPRRAF